MLIRIKDRRDDGLTAHRGCAFMDTIRTTRTICNLAQERLKILHLIDYLQSTDGTEEQFARLIKSFSIEKFRSSRRIPDGPSGALP